MAVNNFDAKCSNIELLLSSRPFDVAIWGKYFMVLEENNANEALLNGYYRYTGIFFNDMDIKDKVLKLNEWIESNKMELDPLEESSERSKLKKLKKAIDNFTFKTGIIQVPPFRQSLNNYIFNHANPRILTKLQSSTKYFLHSLKPHVVERLEISDEPKIF
uniref:Uncharacterized protein n=1 Tax=Panagrolaimus davidi TaxID=227884 RepID=A0A914QN34_9BILA